MWLRPERVLPMDFIGCWLFRPAKSCRRKQGVPRLRCHTHGDTAGRCATSARGVGEGNLDRDASTCT